MSLDAPVQTYAVLTVGAAVFISIWLFIQSAGWLIVLLPTGLAVGAVFGQVRFAGPVMLALVIGLLSVSRPRGEFVPLDTTDQFMNWLVCLAVLAFLVAHSRFMSLKMSVFPPPRRLATRWKSETDEAVADTGARRRDPATCSAGEFWDVLIWGMVSLLIAQTPLLLLPGPDPGGQHRFWSAEFRVIALTWGGGLPLAAIFGWFAYRRWVNLSRREAGVYLRAVLWQWNAKEQEAVEKYAARRRRKEV